MPFPASAQIITTLFIANLHCPSCARRIEESLVLLDPTLLASSSIYTSILSHSTIVRHHSNLPVQSLVTALGRAGFEVHSVFQDDQFVEGLEGLTVHQRSRQDWADDLDLAIKSWRVSWRHSLKPDKRSSSTDSDHWLLDKANKMGLKRLHAEHCPECRAEMAGIESSSDEYALKQVESIALNEKGQEISVGAKGTVITQSDLTGKDDFIVIDSPSEARPWRVELSIVGMTCSACVGSITRLVEELPFVRTVNVALLTNSATVVFEGKQHVDDVVTTIEDAGFDASIENLEEVVPKEQGKAPQQQSDMWKATFAIGGMTCSACVGSITNAIKELSWVETVDINLISNSGTVVFQGKDNVNKITETIEDTGFDVTLDSMVSASQEKEVDVDREILVKIDGMYCHHCPGKIMQKLGSTYGEALQILKAPTNQDPILKLRYIARVPSFTIRTILATIRSTDDKFIPSIYHPPTIEDRARELHARERKRILLRLALSVTAAVPAFIIGVVCMNLLMAKSEIRMFMMHPMWAGNVSRSEWALFILATPVYFFGADTFHKKAFKEIKALWRPGSPTPFLQRFTRFGSMNMLMSLGTTIAYFSSVAELALAATQKPVVMTEMAPMTADGAPAPAPIDEDANSSNYFDSVIFLTMFLLAGRFIEAYSKAKTGDAVTSLGKLRPTEAILVEEEDVSGRKLAVDLLEVGDVVLVHHGSSPPFDGVIVDGSSKFDESSLTGESRLVGKEVGDAVFSGTVNKGGPVQVRLTSVSGTSMLDQIIKIVREGQTKRAPVERAADIITSHFVPFVVSVGIITWVVWLALGTSHTLPSAWVVGQTGGWPLWSLRFAIAVFVVACPCGIGLAAPTALFVGGGMAAQHGILVKGGGEAFQEASALDCIVFDKTGTLTSGGDPAVTDYKRVTDDDEKEILGMVKRLEESSGHPVAKAVVNFCANKTDQTFIPVSTDEVPGKGMKGAFRLDEGAESAIDVEVIVGNEALMTDFDVQVDPASYASLQNWKHQGRSVVLVAVRASDPFADPVEARWALSAMFAIADALRPEARDTVAALQQRGIAVWMLSGDNPTTAQAVGAQVGIFKENIIAGVLPDQKAEKIQWLQKTLPKPKRKQRATVAMVGDGINDSPALTMADVGIAIGSGSDVAISSAEFILISSDLQSLLTLIDLSRAVFRRVWFNFGWALVYNIIAMPIAAGVFYPIVGHDGKHVRLDPVWASLAMALSSVSVICSSLLLRSRIPGVGFRSKQATKVLQPVPSH